MPVDPNLTPSTALSPRAIEATAVLSEALASLGDAPAEAGRDTAREAALALFRRHLARIQQQVREGFEQGQFSGLEAALELSDLTDGLICQLFAHAKRIHPSSGDRLSLVATGGYGRGVLAPFSDIDLLFLTDPQPSASTLQSVEFMLYFLWDLGLKVGHATRGVAECLSEADADLTIRTSLLDARFLAGDGALYTEFDARFEEECRANGAGEFISAKQHERAMRHRRFGESPYLVEPNIKEGRGGLRDLQTLGWIALYLFGTRRLAELVSTDGPAKGMLNSNEARLGRRSWEFLWTVRFHLHYVAGRAEERLTFDMQPVVGARMGYTRHGKQNGVERFMRHYFLTVRQITRLTRVLEPALVRAALGPPAVAAVTDEALLNAGFVLADGKLLPLRSEDFADNPIQMLRILQVARDRDLELHPLAMRALIRNERAATSLRDDPEASTVFMDLLCGRDPERADSADWLSVLNEVGFLSRFLPDWGRIVGQMQFDTYHIYTVDEHTIEVVRVLNMMERGELGEIAPVASNLVQHLQSRRALYLGVIMHDMCKGRGGEHSVVGADLAMTLGPALGLSAEETETVSWLVLHHLLLSQTAFKRDIDDPKTILDLADVIQSPERLRLLLVLTVCDMRAVSPKVWNGWKATLLRELYTRVAEVLAGGLSTTERDVRVSRAKDSVIEQLPDWNKADIEQFLSLGYPGYWLSFDPESHARHARLVRDAEQRGAPLVVDTQPLPARAVTEVTVYTADHAGLFSRIAGSLAVAGASIVDARIHTMTNGMALDTFWVQDAAGGAFDQPHRLAKLYVLIEQALSGRLKLGAEIKKMSKTMLGSRMRAIHVPPRVVIDNRASNTHTVLEVNGRDRPGLLHDVTSAINEQGLQIASAHVTTYGVRAVDVFYVKDIFGLKVENERKLQQLRVALLAALQPPDGEQAPATPSPSPVRRRKADVA